MPTPEAFDSHQFRQHFLNLQEKAGIELGGTYAALGGKRLPAVPHFDRWANRPDFWTSDSPHGSITNSLVLQFPHESGALTHVELMQRERDRSNLYGWGLTHFGVEQGGIPLTNFNSLKDVDDFKYEGPEHLHDLVSKHHSDINEQLRSGKIHLDPDTKATNAEELRTTDPSSIRSIWHDLSGSSSVSGHFAGRNYQFRRAHNSHTDY
jgi:hypothetical protein